MRDDLNAARARELFDYNPDTGRLKRKLAGEELAVGTIRDDGYSQVVADGRLYRVPRLIWLIVTGEWPAGIVDHEDRDTWNNKWTNLRDTTQQVNRHNSAAAGVTWCKRDKKWIAKIKNFGVATYLGRFSTREAAVAAYKEAKAKYLP